ncbi:50S ribosomal protein L15 [Halobacteriales archaeon SW_7_65_23]|nr:MAG: 50S ribosomal protein L15 [Halobacteriales archaeon SW_7_65_23]
MTDKKKRQRGSRTHGAGRDKHEKHNHPPLGEEGSGFSRPEKVKDEVRTVSVGRLDEDAAVLAAEGLADSAGDGYTIDARDVVDDGHDADVVKVLGDGQVHNKLEIVADAFSDIAAEKIEDAGGYVTLSDRADGTKTDEANTDETEED